MIKSPKTTHRTERLAEGLKAYLSSQIQGIISEHGIIAAVSHVQIAKAKRKALVEISIIQGDDEKTLELITSQQRRLETQVFTEFALPVKLELEFAVDTGPRHAQHITDLIGQNSHTHLP